MKKYLKLLFILMLVWFLLWLDTNWYIEETVQYDSLTWDVQDEREIKRLNILEQVESVVWNLSISTAIVDGCMNTTEDWYLCINNLMGVANAESSLFKRVSNSNNPFWLMRQWTLMRFNTIEDSIYYWIQLYQKNQRFKRTDWASRLRWNYCASQCTYRVGNYNYAIAKLSLTRV